METTRESSLKILDINVDAIVLNPENINEMTPEVLNRLIEEIKEVGFIDPVNVVPIAEGKYFMLGGEHRYKAAVAAGLKFIPSIVHTEEKWTDQDLLDLVSFRLNVLRGTQNPEKFLKLYDRMAKKFGPESLQDVFAVTDKSLWKKLTKGIKANLKKAGVGEDVLTAVTKAENKAKDFNQFTKYFTKILQAQASGAQTKCIVFINNDRENIIVEASDNLFNAMKALRDVAAQQNKSLSDIMESAILKLIAEIGS